MIYYFSGTGNSRHVAEVLAKSLNLQLFKIGESIARNELASEVTGLVFPIYSWGVPPIVLKFIEKFGNSFKRNIWAVCSCGDETGNAPKQLAKALKEKGITLDAFWSVQMPNNYVSLPGFDVDSKEVEQKKLDACDARIESIAKLISLKDWKFDYVSGSVPALRSLVWPLFAKWGINVKLYHVTDACISCGKCASVCPVINIKMTDGKPAWGEVCTGCLACYHYCPTHAVQYGSLTRHKGQYHFPD